MTDDIISDELRDFILSFIDSITQLEGLLLLRANPDGRWDATLMSKRLYTNERDVEAALAGLCANGLLSCEDGIYRYEPGLPRSRALVDQLAAAYARHLIPVTSLIHAKERHIRDFAAAFRFRKDS